MTISSVIFAAIWTTIASTSFFLASGFAEDRNLLPDLVEKIRPGVVHISSNTLVSISDPWKRQFYEMWGFPTQRKQSSLGSGFIIDQNGYIFSNAHVVGEAKEVTVALLDGREFPARVIGTDRKLDLALLQLRQRVSGIVPLALGDSDKVRIAETVVAIGNPFGLKHTVTKGIISAKDRTVGIGPLDNFLQTDAAINPGNSGGPLFNLDGDVIGINASIISKVGDNAGLAFAIPINAAKKVLSDLKRYGRVPRPWLGVKLEKVTPKIQSYYGLGRGDGVLIYKMLRNAPANRARLKNGDIVFEVEGNPVKTPLEFERELIKKKPKETIAMRVQRGKRQINVKVKLTELPPRVERSFEGII